MPNKVYALPARRFGVELEARPVVSMRRMARLIERANQSVRICNGYEHTHNNFDWVVKGDHSCRTAGSYWGLEVCSPPLQSEDGLIKVRAVLEDVRRFVEPREKYLVSDNCGFHVHVDCSDYQGSDLHKLIMLYLRVEDVLFGLVAKDRKHNGYCKPWGVGVWNEFRSLHVSSQIRNRYIRHWGHDSYSDRRHQRRPSRHLGLNLAWFWSHGRAEFRMHHGTWHRDEVDRWVRLCVGLVEAAKNMRSVSLRKAATLDEVLRTVGMYSGWADDYREFFMARLGQMARSVSEDVVYYRSRGDAIRGMEDFSPLTAARSVTSPPERPQEEPEATDQSDNSSTYYGTTYPTPGVQAGSANNMTLRVEWGDVATDGTLGSPRIISDQGTGGGITQLSSAMEGMTESVQGSTAAVRQLSEVLRIEPELDPEPTGPTAARWQVETISHHWPTSTDEPLSEDSDDVSHGA